MQTYDLGEVRQHKRTRLPHWDVEHGVQFMTFNQQDALPCHVRARIHNEANAQTENIKRLRGTLTDAEYSAIATWKRRQLQRELDLGHGTCALRDPTLAAIVEETIHFYDQKLYDLLSWSVMPNHVHVSFGTTGEPLDRVVGAMKGYTSKQINKLLGRSGTFWERDYFDRAMRSADELRRVVDYIVQNPLKAGLLDWRFYGSHPDRLQRYL